MRQLRDLLITWVLSLKTFILNQVNCQEQRQFRRCTLQRDALEAYNVDNCYQWKDNYYRQPTTGNRIRSIERAQLHSTAVNWAAPSDAEIAIDKNDYITPERVRLTRTQREVYLSRSKSAYGVHPEEMPSGEAHLRWEWGYCDRILDVHLPFQANTISANSVTGTYDATNADARLADLQRLQLCWARWLSEARRMLHPTPNTDSEVLPVVNYQVTWKRANSQLILRYYVDRQPFSLSRWQSGVPMTSIGGPQIPRLLDLEAIHTTYFGVRQCYRPPVHGWGRCMQSKFWALTSSSSELVDNNPQRLDGNWLLIL